MLDILWCDQSNGVPVMQLHALQYDQKEQDGAYMARAYQTYSEQFITHIQGSSIDLI